MFYQNPPYMASRQLLIPRIAAPGTSFSPLPCQAWHGYMVTSDHRVEVGVSADGPASAPHSGAAGGAHAASADDLVFACCCLGETVPCLRSYLQIRRFDRCSASQLCCMAVIYLVRVRLIKRSRSGHAHPEYPWSPSRLRSRGHFLRNRCLPGIQTIGCDCPKRIRCLRIF
jgi:hypothetical protein